jgi:mono/diheme cytochrome c family protein
LKKYGVWLAIAALAGFVVVAVAFGGNRTDGGTDSGTGIPVQDPDIVAAGEPLYQASCAECHGTDLRGTDTGPSHLSIVYQPSHYGDVAFVLAARNGVQQHHWPFGDMAPVLGLSDDDLDAIVAYVRENQRIFGFEPYPP